jgi:hypothetical protein
MERVRRHSTTTTDKPLLIPRVEAKRKLRCSTDTLARLEKDGVLTPIKLRRRGYTYYRFSEIEALALNGAA